MADSHIPSHSRRSLGRILFPAKTGVRQGCSLSLLLFIIVIEWHLLPSSSPPGLSTIVNQPRNNTVTSKWPGIYINAQRAKMIRINSKQTDSIKIRNTRYSLTNLSRKYCQYIWGTNEDTKTRKKKSQQFLRCKDQCWGVARALSRASTPSSEYLTPTWSQYPFMGLKLG